MWQPVYLPADLLLSSFAAHSKPHNWPARKHGAPVPGLAAEVAQRGRVLERCSVADRDWRAYGLLDPRVQVVCIGQGPMHLEQRHAWGCGQHWPCTCGSRAECLGPKAFGGVRHAWR